MFSEALEVYDAFIKINPDDTEVYYNKGTILSEVEKHDEAIENYYKAQ